MDIELERKVNTEQYQLLMSIGRKVVREDLLSVLMLAKENKRRVTPSLICKELLGGSPNVVGVRIISRCAELGLLNKISGGDSAELSEQGRVAIDDGIVFLPERGLFNIVYSEDPLIKPKCLLDCYASKGGDSKKNEKDSEKIEDRIKDKLLDKTFDLLGKEQDRIKILNIEEHCLKLDPPGELKIKIKIPQYGAPKSVLDGLYRRIIDTPDSITHEKAWRSFLQNEDIISDWDEEEKYLNVGFDETDENQRSTFTKDISFPSPSLPIYGKFEKTIVKDIPIRPKNKNDAQRWADWRIDRGITDYMTAESYRSFSEEIKTRFYDFSVKILERRELAKQKRRNQEDQEDIPAAYWYLQAPLDLREGGATNGI